MTTLFMGMLLLSMVQQLQQLEERLVEILGGGQPASVGAAGHAGRGCMRADGACARERRSLCASASVGEGGDG